MKLSQHATTRCQQRGIPIETIHLFDRLGETLLTVHDADRVHLPKRIKNSIIAELKRQINLIEKAGKIELVIAPDDDQVITAYFQ